MPDKGILPSSVMLDSFGDLLKYLRRRAQLTQRELAIAVGYSEAHLSRLEKNQRLPDLATLAALFIPALGLEEEPEIISRLLELAAISRGESLPSGGKFTVTQSVSEELAETVETIEVPSNLPLQLTSFIGRETEIEELKRLLREEKFRLLTLVGAGGCGKTRLALQIAEQLVPDYPHGTWFVDLTPVTDSNLVPRTTAAILGISESHSQETIKNLVNFLRPKKTLIVFDNCEQILTGVAELIESLLRTCPQLQILTTTREVLNIPGEKQFHVSPLPTPPKDSALKVQDISAFDSVQLFVQRARNVRSDFDLTNENAANVAQVCRRLDGIPLAIELAAARVSLLRVHQIESQLNDRFKLLTGGNRALPRHQTLQAMVDWSHDLLSEEDQKFFRRLSLFSGGWTLDSANAVAADTASDVPTLEILSHLVDKSFINVERLLGEEARYTMLETLREYAFDKLSTVQETAPTRARHFDFFYALTQQARLYGNEKGWWLDKLEVEFDNIRAALSWWFEHNRDNASTTEKAMRMVLSVLDFYWFRGFTVEGREWMDRFIAVEMPASPLHALLLQKAGWFARANGDFKIADTLLKRALDMAKDVGDWNRAAWALGDLGLSARDQGDKQQSIRYFTQGLKFARQSGEDRAIGVLLFNLAESYELLEDLNKAEDLWEQGLNLFREAGDKTHIAWGLEGLAGTAYLAKDVASALKFHLESLRIKVEVMDRLGIAYSLEGLAQVAAAAEPERASILWGAASRLREIINIPVDPSREVLYTALIPNTREQLGEQVFDTAWKRGEVMKLDEAIEYALSA